MFSNKGFHTTVGCIDIRNLRMGERPVEKMQNDIAKTEKKQKKDEKDELKKMISKSVKKEVSKEMRKVRRRERRRIFCILVAVGCFLFLQSHPEILKKALKHCKKK